MTNYAAIYDALYANGYNNHPSGWGVKVGMLPWMVENCDFCSVLDVGCGRGQDVVWLLERGKDAHGVDVSIEAVGSLGKRYGVRDLASDSGWGLNIYDAVVSSDVLEHLVEDDVRPALMRMVEEARRFIGLRTAAFATKSGERCGFGTDQIHPTRKPVGWWIEQLDHAAGGCGRWMKVRQIGKGWFVAELR